MELGGKSPCIVDETANLRIAARRIVWGKFMNAGQTCIAPDYLLVKRDVKKQLINEIYRAIITMYGTTPLASPDYPHIVNERQFARFTRYITENISKW